jgi:hypothetical protein
MGLVATLIVASVTALSGCASAPNRLAAGNEEPWVVSLGDSFISGEAGRWAGNETLANNDNDALGATAYSDTASGEAINRCHRSRSAAIGIGVVKSMNFACSGATTNTQTNAAGDFKPGIDFYSQGSQQGQALMLQEFASTHAVKLVALSIGGNDFNFSTIIATCIKSFLKPAIFGSYCQENATVQSSVNAQAAEKVRADTKKAILNIATAMQNAGYKDGDWTLGLQLYPNVLASASDMRYTESGYDRQLIGGCGVRDRDLSWSAANVVPLISSTFSQAAADAQKDRPGLRVITVRTADAFSNHTLCNKTVSRVASSGGAQHWSNANAVDRSEWVMEINMVNPNETYRQESLHPNYWGQLALRSCWRQAWNNGDVRGGNCVPAGAGLSSLGEPNMVLQ